MQNRVAQALPRLPQEVQRVGVTTEKASPDFMMVVHLISPDERYNMLYLSNYAHLRVKDELARIGGVGSVQIFGAGEYSMRVWLDPNRLAARQLTATDVVRAIREQNVQVAAGVLGAPPAPSDTTFQLSINAQGRLQTEERVRRHRRPRRARTDRSRGSATSAASSSARARTRCAACSTTSPPWRSASPSGPGSNAIEASSQVRATMEHAEEVVSRGHGLPHRLRPDDLRARSRSARSSRRCSIAILLVVIVVMVFLQTWRASIIPLVAVPVSLIGTFAVMLMFGFSLNTLSLFGLVLAIGIVVDDAIVVVENVERHIQLGETPIEATRKAMDEVSGPDHRDRAGAVRGVRADRVRQRADRAVLPPVRADHRDLDGDLRVQLADAQPGAGVAAAAAARRAEGSRAARWPTGCSAGSSGCSTASSRARRRSTPAAWRGCCVSRRRRWSSTSG